MNLKDAQHKLSADISTLYETYQLISKNKQQFNELDVALLQQQLLYVYHSLLKVQSHMSQLPPEAEDVVRALSEAETPELPEVPVVNPAPSPETAVTQPEIKAEETKEPEPEVVAPPVSPKRELTFDFSTPVDEKKPEPTLDDLEKLMREQEEEEERQQKNMEPEQVQTSLPLEAPKPQVTPAAEPQELSLLDKLSASIRTPDSFEKMNRDQQSLKQSINLNKKIAFVNNLFNENTVEYAKAIEKLNSSSSLHEALRYFNELKHQYNWNNENVLVKELENLIEKRYS